MKTYTVIAVYDSNGQLYQNQCQAETEFEAFEKVADYDRDDLQFVAAIEGDVVALPPCESSGTTAYACDLTELETSYEAGKHDQ